MSGLKPRPTSEAIATAHKQEQKQNTEILRYAQNDLCWLRLGAGVGFWRLGDGWWWDFDELPLGAEEGDEVVDLWDGELLAEGWHTFAAVVNLFGHLFDGFAFAD